MIQSPSDVRLQPLSNKYKDKLEASGSFTSVANGVPCADTDVYEANTLVPTCTGRCEMYDLSREEDRAAYADMCAKLLTQPERYVRLWEERVSQPDGRLVTYMTFTEQALISQDLYK